MAFNDTAFDDASDKRGDRTDREGRGKTVMKYYWREVSLTRCHA